MPPWLWIVVGIALAIAEIFAPGTLLLWTGVAAVVLGFGLAAADLAGLAPWGWQPQLLAFILLAIASVLLGLKLRHKPPEALATRDVNIGSARLVGQRARLETAITDGRGSLRIGDTLWQVTGPDLPAGTNVRISASDGIVLTVEPAPP
jgi:membrane protein implicated in regulation of membrane protease activity